MGPGTEDSKRKSLAVKAGLKRKAERGSPHGGNVSYGYRRLEGKLEIVRDQAEIVRRIFSEFVAGKPQTDIARDLQSEGVPTVGGGKWLPSTVRNILHNPSYIGKVRSNGEVFPGQHEPIIEAKTWQQAAALFTATPERRGRHPKGQHLFRGGFLRCGKCGDAMVPRTHGKQQLYYCDGHSKMGDEFCDQKTISRAPIDEAVYRYFEQVGLDVDATRQQLAESREAKLAEVNALLEQAQRADHKATENFERHRGHYRDGSMPRDEWVNEWEPELTADLTAAKAEVERLREQQEEVSSWGEVRDVEEDALRRLAEIRQAIAGEIQDAEGLEAVRAALTRLFESFTVHRTRPNPTVERTDKRPDPDNLAFIAHGDSSGRYLILEPHPHQRVARATTSRNGTQS